MFDHHDAVIGLWPGERPEDLEREDDFVYELTCRELADGWVDSERHVLPDDLDDLLPGPYLAAIVAAVDPRRLNGHDAVRLMKARARLSSHQEAGKLEAMAEVAYSPPGDADTDILRSSEEVEYAAVEIAAALCMTRRASEDQLSRAIALAAKLWKVQETFSHGRLDLPRVRVLEQTLAHLPSETVEEVLDQVLEDAPGLTTGQLRARVAKLALMVDPDGSKSSFEEGLADRRAVVSSNPDHTANYQIFSGRPEDVVAARDYVETLARALKTKNEPRTLDQLRNDVALDLLRGRCVHRRPRAGGGRTHITVSAETLAGLAETPGELEGYGDVFAEIARKTVGENIDGDWTFTVTDNGRPVATGTLARRPTAAQRRGLRSEYPTCVFPGCRQPSFDCDLDHRKPFSQGGPTDNDNLGPLCRHHHMVRHHAPWQLARLPDGDHLWVSPLGHTYTRKRGPPASVGASPLTSRT